MGLINNKVFKQVFFTLFFFLIAGVAFSQPGDPGGDPDNPVPIDGISVLLAMGGALGAKKIYDFRKEK